MAKLNNNVIDMKIATLMLQQTSLKRFYILKYEHRYIIYQM